MNIYGSKPNGSFVIVRFQVVNSAARIANGLITSEKELNVRIIRSSVVGRQNPGDLGQTGGRQWTGLIVEIYIGIVHI